MTVKSSLIDALEKLLVMLNDELEMDLWMITRVLDNDWTIIAASDNTYGVGAGDVLPWDESVCSRMVKDLGPNIAPEVCEHDPYQGAPIVTKLPICAYVGYPIFDDNGELIGTLCAIDQTPKACENINENFLKGASLIAQTLLNQHDTIDRLQTVINKFDAQSAIDDITGLPNQIGFFDLAFEYKEKYDAIGAPIGVAIIELSGLGLTTRNSELSYHDVLREIASGLGALIRKTDTLCKLDGSKFAILMLNVDTKYVSALVRKIASALDQHDIKKSIGADVCREGQSINESIERANTNRMI